MAQQFESVEDYIASFPETVQEVLEEIRATIHQVVPGAGEAISYQIAAVTLDGRPVVHFAGWKHHVSLYPMPEVDDGLGREVAPYLSGKSTVKFPLSEPVPHQLVERLVSRLLEQRRGAT
ncbi:hypothetical protein BH18ACT9_BH18ACT9_21720 [soil metagenome]